MHEDEPVNAMTPTVGYGEHEVLVVVSVSVEERRRGINTGGDRPGISARVVLTRPAGRDHRADLIDEIGAYARSNARRAIAALED